MKNLLLSSVAIGIIFCFGSLFAQDYSGTYTEPQNSSVSIQQVSNGYELAFSTEGKVYAIGTGYVINGKLYFTFARTDKTTDGGFGVYSKEGENLKAYHYHLDFNKRWSGVYTKQ